MASFETCTRARCICCMAAFILSCSAAFQHRLALPQPFTCPRPYTQLLTQKPHHHQQGRRSERTTWRPISKGNCWRPKPQRRRPPLSRAARCQALAAARSLVPAAAAAGRRAPASTQGRQETRRNQLLQSPLTTSCSCKRRLPIGFRQTTPGTASSPPRLPACAPRTRRRRAAASRSATTETRPTRAAAAARGTQRPGRKT
jgi:hypothetical protein